MGGCIRPRTRRHWLLPVLPAVLGATLLADEGTSDDGLRAHQDLLRHLTARPVPGTEPRSSERPGAGVAQWLATRGGRPESGGEGVGGTFIWPLASYRLTSTYSTRRWHPILARYRPHLGLDLAAAPGTPVRAAAPGMVVFAGWDEGGGNVLKIAHDGGYLTAYLHLQRFAPGIAVGRRVEQGEVIGAVGGTGRATGPHLDYRISLHGRWLDPLEVMEPTPAAGASQE